MSLKAVRERKAAKTTEARALLAKAESESRELTTAEAGAFDKLKGEITELEAAETRQQFLEEAERRQAGTVVSGDRGTTQLEQLEGQVSLLKIVQAQVERRDLTGAEAEYNQETARRLGRSAEGVFAPMAALEKRQNTAASAPELIGTDHRGQDYIPALRNALLARRLGVRVLSGLRANVSIPKHGTSTVTGWVADNSPLTPSSMSFDSVGLTPRHVGSLSESSRSLLLQSDPSIEQLLRDDMSFGIAQAIDSALIHGGNSNEPDGITATLGTSNGTLAGPTWAQVLAVVQQVEDANALGSHSWLTNPGAKAKLSSTLKVASDAGAGFLMEGGRMADFPVHTTNQIAPASTGTDNTVIFGDWSAVLLGLYSELDVLVNPFSETAYAKGSVLIRAMASVDIAIRHEEAFVWADDCPPL